MLSMQTMLQPDAIHTLRVWPVRAVVNVCPLVNVLVVMAMPGTTWYCRSCSTHELVNAVTTKRMTRQKRQQREQSGQQIGQRSDNKNLHGCICHRQDQSLHCCHTLAPAMYACVYWDLGLGKLFEAMITACTLYMAPDPCGYSQ